MKKIVTEGLGLWLGFVCWVNGITTDPYIELKSGVCMVQKRAGVHYKAAPCFSGELGISWESWRLGLEMGYKKFKIKDVDNPSKYYGTVFDTGEFGNLKFSAVSFMVNFYHDWHYCENLNLYVGFGLGVTRLNYRFSDTQDTFGGGNGVVYNQDKYLLAAQVMCGVSYDVSDHWSVSLGYRCMKMESVKYNWIAAEAIWPSLKTPFLHSLELGLRYRF